MSDSFTQSYSQNYYYIDRFDSKYPEKLQCIKDPPSGIYVKGTLPDPDKPCVAIVGSRICSSYGRLCATEFGKALAENGVQVISGLARGIDAIAQNSACEAGGSSFGILGCGINVIYPAQNKHIYEKILEKGGLISEFSPSAPPIGRQFAIRNRIISALSDIVLVIEAKEKSGTGITVTNALEQGKDIYALPGRIYDICSSGCNRLISQGAGVAISPQTILEALGINSSLEKPSCNILEPLEKKVFDKLDFYPTSLDVISTATHILIPELLNILFHLQMKGFIKEEGRHFYSKIKEI